MGDVERTGSGRYRCHSLTAVTWWVMGTSGNSHSGVVSISFGVPASRYVLPNDPLPFEPPAQASLDRPRSTSVHEMPIAGPDKPPVAVNLGAPQGKAEPESTAVVTPGQRSLSHYRRLFPGEENADRFISELQAKGFAASLIDRKGGLIRGIWKLSHGPRQRGPGCRRKEEAPDAWLLVK